ncbi:hypothetical protein DCAR_0518692 [Daucus carota subsp. sativus]|uniref:Uncharacterized protein n=1 Tax=Daucus carota subsp. sativus TaxID=79200 RepID=A0A161YIL1_DAUCS|nr:PREDICTED: uncharacterized protein At4g14100-like [Daucus carota subsp. sativus]WOG99344.1 hypothetical protein DCAR_0518692 [Daucus carota subsp. sativus]
MAIQLKPTFLTLLILLTHSTSTPTPTPWPEQFHSAIFMTTNGTLLQKVDLWYDWPNGRNFNIIQSQLGKLLYDLEWTNGTSFYYTLDQNQECRVVHFGVGILPPDWLSGASYVGQKRVDGFLCNVWEKVEFITYYEDVASKRPVSWTFYTGMTAHIMTFEVGKVLDDPNWQAPVYCFNNAAEQRTKGDLKRSGIAVESVASTQSTNGHHQGSLMRSLAMNLTAAL